MAKTCADHEMALPEAQSKDFRRTRSLLPNEMRNSDGLATLI
jgi:hypothetical protein